MISCGDCHDELRTATFYEPPHDIRHRQGVRSSCHNPWPPAPRPRGGWV